MTQYPLKGVASYDETFSITPLLPNGNLLTSAENHIKTLYFQYYKLNDKCTLIFKHPTERSLDYLSMACVY
uniref:hypothetical protein n=1 Tax=Thaumasiovibrio occultus TaxID=1891184 RepID=UPI00131E3ED5|nr:hypothetical protein [Thaumasiovibrio occultus]